MLSTEAVSAHIDIPVPTLNTWRSLGKGPVFYKLGKLIRYRLSDFESWINSNRRGPDESQETIAPRRTESIGDIEVCGMV